DPVRAQDLSDRCGGHAMTETTQLALDPRVAPGRIFARQPDDQGHEFAGDRPPPDPGRALPPLPSHQPPATWSRPWPCTATSATSSARLTPSPNPGPYGCRPATTRATPVTWSRPWPCTARGEHGDALQGRHRGHRDPCPAGAVPPVH